MNISGVLVQAAPAKLDYVRAELLKLQGVDIPLEEKGRLVVIIDETGANRSGEALMKIQNIPGVLSANLVYQHDEQEQPPSSCKDQT